MDDIPEPTALAKQPREDPITYEDFVKTTDLKVDADDDVQFYFDGYNEEHGEISGVIKRMRRGDYDEMSLEKYGVKVSEYLIQNGLKATFQKFDECLNDFVKEVGDEHWYLTRILQVFKLTWKIVEDANQSKLGIRKDKGLIMGKGSNREVS